MFLHKTFIFINMFLQDLSNHDSPQLYFNICFELPWLFLEKLVVWLPVAFSTMLKSYLYFWTGCHSRLDSRICSAILLTAGEEEMASCLSQSALNTTATIWIWTWSVDSIFPTDNCHTTYAYEKMSSQDFIMK